MGVVMVTWTGDFLAPGTIITITTDNYFRGNLQDQMNKLDLTKTITNEGLNANGNIHFHVVATINVTFFNGETASRNVDREKEWVAGAATPQNDDDVIL